VPQFAKSGNKRTASSRRPSNSKIGGKRHPHERLSYCDNSAVVESGLFSIVEATNFNVEEIYKISKLSLYTVVVGTKKIESVNG
jgi:hypothetical protein